jgi:hypothetical protein
MLEFGHDGNSHSLPLVLPIFQDPACYSLPSIKDNLNYTVLIDTGIIHETQQFRETFLDSPVIKICYTDHTWPVIAVTSVTKAMQSSLEKQAAVSMQHWPEQAEWAQREKYFLYLRDNYLRHHWKSDLSMHTLEISDLTDYNLLWQRLAACGIELEHCQQTWQQWWYANHYYFQPIIVAQEIIDKVNSAEFRNLDDIKDTWTQAVIYYYIWLTWSQEVPHNDYQHFFTDTLQIRAWLNL